MERLGFEAKKAGLTNFEKDQSLSYFSYIAQTKIINICNLKKNHCQHSYATVHCYPLTPLYGDLLAENSVTHCKGLAGENGSRNPFSTARTLIRHCFPWDI